MKNYLINVKYAKNKPAGGIAMADALINNNSYIIVIFIRHMTA